ncbi:MAG: cbb3-type cytochrome c oxidase subunit I [Actinomycetota bacterium]|nr:cbb3-type cytochrome c oxidase subunit I [Actinomycetota bacterium]
MAIADTAPDVRAEPPAEAAEQPGPEGPAGTDHKAVGTLFVVVALAFLVASGIIALFMRAQLSAPDVEFMWNRSYRQLFTLHGIFGVFLFLAPAWVGVATAVVPLQIGASRLAFARLQVFSLVLLLFGGGMIAYSPFAYGGAITSGWSLSAPIPVGRLFRGQGPELLVLGLGVVGIALTLAAVNLIVTIVRLRAPGLTLRRTPLFSWSVLVSSSVLLLALPVLVGSLVMLFVDQHYNGRVFSGFTGSNGGNPLLWPRLFWFAAYPTLWALLLPALGTVSEIIPVFTRTRLFSHQRARLAMVGIGVLAFVGWGSEVPNLRGAKWLFALGALAVLAPVASLVLNWLATAGKGLMAARKGGDKPRTGARAARQSGGRSAPTLHAGGLIVVLALGLAAAVVSAVDATGGSHTNHWSVGMQHTLFFGTGILGFFAAIYYWGPKLWGRHLSEGLGKMQLGVLMLGLVLTVVPMFVLGIQDMHVHLSRYPDDESWQAANVAVGIGGAITVFAVVLFLVNLLVSVAARRGRRADANPWSGGTLEWATASPPPPHDFDAIPEIRSETPLLDMKDPASEGATQ